MMLSGISGTPEENFCSYIPAPIVPRSSVPCKGKADVRPPPGKEIAGRFYTARLKVNI